MVREVSSIGSSLIFFQTYSEMFCRGKKLSINNSALGNSWSYVLPQNYLAYKDWFDEKTKYEIKIK